MRNKKAGLAGIFTVALLLTLISCRRSPEGTTETVSGSRRFASVDLKIADFSGVFSIEKVIRPEASGENFFSHADRIKIDAEGGIFILDKSSPNGLLHFDSAGRFLNRFGRQGQGPGEFEQIQGFDLGRDGSVYLLTPLKILKFDKAGRFLLEKKLDFFGADIRVANEDVYIFVLRGRGQKPDQTKALKVLDSTFREKEPIVAHDARLDKYLFLPNHILDGNEGKLFFVEVYDLSFSIYDLARKSEEKYVFESDNRSLAAVWDKKPFDEVDREKIRKNIHRFNDIFSFGQGLYLFELCSGARIFNIWLLNFGQNKIIKVPYFDIFDRPGETENRLRFDYAAGSYKDGLILVLENQDLFKRYRSLFPEMGKVMGSPNDNPLLIFAKIKY